MSTDRDAARAGLFDDLESEEEDNDDDSRLERALTLSVWYFRAQGFVIGIVVTSLVWFLAS